MTKWRRVLVREGGTFVCCFMVSFAYSLLAQLHAQEPIFVSTIKITAATTVLVTFSMLMLRSMFSGSFRANDFESSEITHRTGVEEPTSKQGEVAHG